MAKQKHNPGKYNFLRTGAYFAIFSTLLTFVALGFMWTKGFNYGIDFAGGTEVQVKFEKPVDSEAIRKFTDDAGLKNAFVQGFGGNSNEWLIRTGLDHGKTEEETNRNLNKTIDKIKGGIQTTFANAKPDIRRIDTVGPQVGAELKRNGVLAMFYSLLVILIYVGLRFDYEFAPGAVICLCHDTLITLGIYSMFGWEVNVQTMAALLTLIGYSLNDTIVIFDRVRENLKVYSNESFEFVINRSINDCLSRTILTIGVTMLAVATLWIMDHGVIADFAKTMVIGMILGAYSTVYVAAPLVIYVRRYHMKLRKAGV